MKSLIINLLNQTISYYTSLQSLLMIIKNKWSTSKEIVAFINYTLADIADILLLVLILLRGREDYLWDK